MPVSEKPWSRRLALVVAAAFFMENLDATILATAAPALAGDFGVAPADIAVTMTTYLLALATFIPVSGWLAGRWGAHRVFSLAILVFTIASIACAFSGDLLTLAIARVVQGIGGSMMVPVGRLIVLRTTQKSDLMRAIAYLTWPALAAPVIAPLVGGVLVEYLGWPWVFYVNVPIGIVLLILARRVVPREQPDGSRSFDVVGFAAITAAIGGFVLGLELIVDPGSAVMAGILMASAAAAGVFGVWWLRRASEPFLDLSSLALPTYRVTNVSGGLFRAAVSAAPFLLPLLLQDGFGWSPVSAGAMVLWVFVGNIAIKPITTPLIRNVGFVPVMLCSGIGLAATFVAMAFMTPDTSIVVIAVVFLLSGVFRSVGFTAYNTIQFADVSGSGMRHANTLSETIGQIAVATGIAVAAMCVRLFDLVDASVDPVFGYRWAFCIMAAVGALSVVGGLMLPKGAASHVRGRDR